MGQTGLTRGKCICTLWVLMGWDTLRSAMYTDLVGCVLVRMAVDRGRLTWILGSRHSCRGAPRPASSNLWRPSIQVLPLLGGARFIACAWGAHFQGNTDGARGIFVLNRRVWATAVRLDPPKIRACATLVRSVGRTQIPSRVYAK